MPAGGGTTTAVPPLIFFGVMPELTLAEVARALDVSPATLRRWAAEGSSRCATAAGRRPRSPTRGSSRACASAATRSAELREAPRTRAGSPSAISRTCSRRGGPTYTLDEAAERDRPRAGADRAHLDAPSGSRPARSTSSPTTTCSCCATSPPCSTPGFPLVAFLQLVRVYGQALAQIADAEVRLFHLYVHEPLIRDGVPGLEIAEEMEDLARELLPLPRRSWTTSTSACCSTSSSRTSSATWRSTSARSDGRARPPARGDRVRRPRRLHAADRGGGRGGGGRASSSASSRRSRTRCPTTRA